MASIGFDAPVVGPVLQWVADALLATGASVSPTGNVITMSVGTVGVSTSRTVTGNAIAFSVGDAFIDRNVSGNETVISVGSVAVNTGGNATVGVNGQAITFGLGTVLVNADANVTPETNQIDITLSQAFVQHDVEMNPTGNEIVISVGDVLVSVVATLVPGFDPATANLNAVISDLVVEDDYDLTRTINGVPDGATLVTAWLTIKSMDKLNAADIEAIIQKEITAIPLGGVGHITDTGADGTGQVTFQLLAAETNLLEAGRWYGYDIQVESSSGKFSTREKGTIVPVRQITQTP